jgi:hypothetical protein
MIYDLNNVNSKSSLVDFKAMNVSTYTSIVVQL